MCEELDDQNQMLINVTVGRKACRFLLDTGAMISVLKPGINQKRIRESNIIARGATGDKLRVYGLQKVGLKIGNNCRIYHDFVVADIKTSYDGLIAVDLMKKLGMRIDFSTKNVYVGNNIISVRNTIEGKSLGTDEEEPDQLTDSSPITATTGNALTLSSNENICNVVTCENYTIPPMSEMLVRGCLNMGASELSAQNSKNSRNSRTDIDRMSIGKTVLVERVELSVHGLRVARLISNVSEDQTEKVNQKSVIMKLINFSRETLDVPNNSVLGVAETFETNETFDAEPIALRKKQSKIINVVKSENQRGYSKIDKEIRDKLVHLSKMDFQILWPVLQKYMHLFEEPVENIGCSSDIRHKIETGDNPPVRKNPYRLAHALKPVSYTHLDVYKRQLYLRLIFCPIRCGNVTNRFISLYRSDF